MTARSLRRRARRRDQAVRRAVVHAGPTARDAGVAKNAVLHAPGDLAVVAGAAEFAVEDLQHVDVVAPGLELEAEIAVADLAAETDAVEPVRKHDRPHAGGVRGIGDDDVGLFRERRATARPAGQ